MAGKKRVLNITVDEDVAADVRSAAEVEGVTISSVVEEALKDHLKWERIRREGLAAIHEYYDEHGWPAAEEMAAAEAEVIEAERLIDEARAHNEARRRAKRTQKRGNVA
ncbi:MAG: type II toxin-antitoxin system CcdA family antitoxin [Streptosporangiaceae bacterium]|nr:type II toxin-antitoxin system CcdA family antitoxin [Streptosporangiaceae bacterium]